MQLNLLVKPVADVTIGTRLIHLYPVRMGDVSGFCGIPDDIDAAAKFRLFLPLVASLSVPRDFREKREALPEELVAAMSGGELEQIASVYAGISSFDRVRSGNGEVAAVARQAGEPAAAYLERLMKAEAERQRLVFEKINTP